MPTEEQAFMLYFGTLVGWTLHPGYLKPGSERLTLEQCAILADAMVAETAKRYGTYAASISS